VIRHNVEPNGAGLILASCNDRSDGVSLSGERSIFDLAAFQAV
jgi:hypothetical protein